MNYQQWLDEHPFRVILGAFTLGITISAGVVGYLTNSLAKIENERLVNDYESQISGIRSNYDYVVRSISGDLKIFDLDKLIINDSLLSRLGDEYQAFGDQDFLIKNAYFDDWEYEFISDDQLRGYVNNLAPQFSEKKKIHFWANDRISKVCFPNYPYQGKCDSGYIKFFSQAFINVIKYEDELEVLEQLSKDGYIGEYFSYYKDSCVATPPLRCQSAEDGFQEFIKEKYTDDMSIDIMLFHLSSVIELQEGYRVWEIDIFNIECKVKLCYFSYRMNYPPGYDEKGNRRSIFVDREIYLIDIDKRLFMLNTIIVNDGVPSDDYKWIDDWLAGIRIPG